MKHFLRYAIMALAIPAFIRTASAADVPRYVNFQAVLRDDNGALLSGDNVNLEFKILDQDGQQLYYESQPGVNLVRSSVNVMLGEGLESGSSTPTGGLPFDVFSPTTGTKFLQMRIDGNQPGGLMELGSVPYAVYAQTALKIDPSILAADIPDIFVTEDELTTYSSNIVTTINNSTSSTTISESRIDSNIARDSEVAAAIASHNHDSAYVNVTGDTMTGSLNVPDSNATPYLSGGNFNVGRALRSHEDRIAAIEGEPSAAFAKAWVRFHTDGDHHAAIDGAFNVSNIAYSGTDDGGWVITFGTPFSDVNYVMVGSAGGDNGGAMMVSANPATSTTSAAHVVGTDKNGNSQTGNSRVYNLVFFGN